MQEKTIISALAHIRAEAIREGKPGLDHTEALLRQRGVDPDSLPAPAKICRHFKRGELQRAILRALQAGPKTSRQVTSFVYVGRASTANASVSVILSGLKKRGLVVREGMVWRLVL